MSEDAKRTGIVSLSMNSSCCGFVGKKVFIKSADMKKDIQKEAVDIAIDAFEKQRLEKDVAKQIKKEFDTKYGPTWHCIVGKNFAVLLFKSG